MAFQGSLKELPLPDIIQLVSVSGKTGKFTLSREGDRGFIYLKNGQMVHATVSDLIGEEAIYALAIWNSGDFQFSPGEEPDRQTISKSNTNLLMEAARRLDEWRVLSKKIPSVEYVPELMTRENRHEQITLNPQEWMLITRIDGHRSIVDIGRTLNMSSFDVAKILYGMITGELVALKKKSEHADDEQNGELIDLAARIRAIAEEYIGDSAHKTIEKHFLHALDGIMNGDGQHAVDNMVHEFEKTASLLRGLAVTEQLRSRITELRAMAM
jgi:acid stress-induced BolA-like protein IbaG/YrbA